MVITGKMMDLIITESLNSRQKKLETRHGGDLSYFQLQTFASGVGGLEQI